MPKTSKPRGGSLQYWPRKRAERLLPSVNWKNIQDRGGGILGFVAYKAGMCRILAKDLTPNSMTKNKQIVLPATVLECPPLKIFSVRFYKNGIAAGEVVISNDRELKRVVKTPKQPKTLDSVDISKYDDLRIIAYSVVKKTGIKKSPDIAEIAIAGTLQEKFDLVKNLMGKEISVDKVFARDQLIDVHGVTKAKGLEGPITRFGISLRQHKSEKGTRRPGTLGPWKPARVSFRAPLAGQLGLFTRVQYNNKILDIKQDFPQPLDNYGIIKNPCIIVKGSMQGPAKRAVLLSIAARPKAKKENFEVVKILK